MNTSPSLLQSGTSMVEILVTLIILLVGLLGLAGLMVQGQRSEMESYQRVQALILLQDMAGRISVNRNAATCYALTTSTANGTPYLGTAGAGAAMTPVPATACTVAAITAIHSSVSAANATLQAATAVSDMNDWHNELLGAAETSGGGNVGAMIGARGCVSYGGVGTELTDPTTGASIAGTGIYTVAIAWQGLGETFAPTAPVNNAAAMSCGKGLYGTEALRRIVSLTLRTASLTSP